MINFRHLTKNIIPSNKNIVVKKALGAIFWDSQGKDYIDFSAQTLNLSLGQCHPEITRAVITQLKKYNFLSSRFVCEPLMQLSEVIINLAPKELSKINIKLTDGSDANESAFKRVRKYHKKLTIASLYKSHLGETSETIVASGKNFENRFYIGGSQKFTFFPPPHPDFIPSCKTTKEAEKISLLHLKSLLQRNNDICAVIVEPIMVNAGVYILSPDYLRGLRALCDEYHVSLIFDEIQTAFGWIGTFFAASKYKITPDIVTLGKAISPGFPLAAVLMQPQYDLLEYGEDEFTNGGNPLSCIVALKNIEILKRMGIEKMVLEKSNLIFKLLSNVQRDYPFIKEIRGEGLIWGVDFDKKTSPFSTQQIYNRALSNGLVLRKSQDGYGSSLVIKPPLIITNNEIEEGIERLRWSLAL
ncbi:MAG: aspartate aminotransferase family protein [Patescibacteria group bacterium]|nr:aspartate aminotransferase family protein [Patescibacteria group bacterium]MCL5095360.1 aspartate aminotransferase family protein [Patescibacteria group bacterium]